MIGAGTETIRAFNIWSEMKEAEAERNRLISFASLIPPPGDSMRRWKQARDLHREAEKLWEDIIPREVKAPCSQD